MLPDSRDCLGSFFITVLVHGLGEHFVDSRSDLLKLTFVHGDKAITNVIRKCGAFVNWLLLADAFKKLSGLVDPLLQRLNNVILTGLLFPAYCTNG